MFAELKSTVVSGTSSGIHCPSSQLGTDTFYSKILKGLKGLGLPKEVGIFVFLFRCSPHGGCKQMTRTGLLAMKLKIATEPTART